MPDPYGSDIETRLPRQPPSEYTPPPPLATVEIPTYLKPIPINQRDVHAVLQTIISRESPRFVRWLYSTWNAEAEAIKYQELRNAVRDGEVPLAWIKQWQQDYSRFVVEVVEPAWRSAFQAAAKALIRGAGREGFELLPLDEGHRRIEEWVETRGVELAVNLSEEQRRAARVVIRRLGLEAGLSATEVGRYLRPIIGLTEAEARAVLRLREELLKAGLDRRAVVHQCGNYAGFLHRHRAQRIAVTELAFAHNFGQFEEVRQSIEAGRLPHGRVVKQFSTSDDERVCPRCGPLDGVIIGLEETFPGATKRLPNVYVPPLHPFCRCAVVYVVLQEDETATGRLGRLAAKIDMLLDRINVGG